MKNNTWKKYMGITAITAVLLVGSVSAYFTDQDEKTNTFTVGKVTIDLEEPEWDKKPDENGNDIPDEAENMTPNQTIEKDPQVKNSGTNDAFVYMTVEVPCKKIVTVNNDGTRNPEAVRELYTYQTDSSWKLLGSVDVTDETGEKTAVKHLYAYAGAQGTCTVIKPQETTKNLFREVTFVNAMEGQGLENGMYKIEIEAFGIQTTDLNGGTNNAAEIWKIISNQRELAESFS